MRRIILSGALAMSLTMRLHSIKCVEEINEAEMQIWIAMKQRIVGVSNPT